MPRISEFFGIVIYMYWMDVQKHKTPHFHARYRGKEAVFALNGKCLAGDLGNTAHRLIQSWCEENQKEIREAWNCAVAGRDIPWIKPLQ